jgi:hypothetical protein
LLYAAVVTVIVVVLFVVVGSVDMVCSSSCRQRFGCLQSPPAPASKPPPPAVAPFPIVATVTVDVVVVITIFCCPSRHLFVQIVAGGVACSTGKNQQAKDINSNKKRLALNHMMNPLVPPNHCLVIVVCYCCFKLLVVAGELCSFGITKDKKNNNKSAPNQKHKPW